MTHALREKTVRAEPGTTHRQRRDIQGLRAVAVLSVVASHFAGWPRGGFVGVDVFFVISGFLITDLLLREYERTGTISFVGFYRRRVKRIMPAATLVLAATIAASYVLLRHARFVSVVKDALASELFFANWHFGYIGVDYFQQSLPTSPLQHYWSLSVEEQFYVVWPWLLLGLMIAGVRLGWWRHQSVRVVAGAAAAAVLVVSLLWAFDESAADPAFAYFSTFSRGWELGFGALTAVVGNRAARRHAAGWVRTALAYVGLAGIVVSIFEISESWRFPAPWALLPVASTALVLYAAAPSEGRTLWPLTNPVSRYLGDISYSLYLWHFPVGILLVVLVPYRSPRYWVIGLVTMFAAAMFSYRVVEVPARKAAWFRGLAPRPGLLAYGLVAVMVLGIGYAAGKTTFSDVRQSTPVAAVSGKCAGPRALIAANGCPSLNTGSAVTPAPAAANDDQGERYECWTDRHEPMKLCTYGSTRPDATQVALFGDSHAAMWLPALMPALDKLNWRLSVLTGYGCSMRMPSAREVNCTALPDMLAAVRRGGYDVVLTSERRYGDTADLGSMKQAISSVQESGAKVVAIADDPLIPQSVFDCVGRVGFTAQSHCEVPATKAYSSPDVLYEAATQTAGVAVVETRQWFCTDVACPAVIGNVIVYADPAGHMTATYARLLAPYFLPALRHAIE